MLVVILDRALTGEEYVEVFDWVHQTYNYLEEVLNSERTTDQNAIEEAITLFKSDLMELCVDLMYRQPASEKVRFAFHEFMTADEMVECRLSPVACSVARSRKRKADDGALRYQV